MKKILILTILTQSFLLFSTTQVSDIVIYKNNSYSADGCPLVSYYRINDYESPFRMSSTANYRGYVATWEIINDMLYLKKIEINQYFYTSNKIINIPLSYLFHDYVENGLVKASWYNTDLVISNSKKDKNYILYIRNGVITSKKEISFKDLRAYNNRFYEKLDSDLLDIDESELSDPESEEIINTNTKNNYSNVVINDNSNSIQLSTEQLNKTTKLINVIYDEYDKKLADEKRKKKQHEYKIAHSFFSKIDGYDYILSEFLIEDAYIHKSSPIFESSISDHSYLRIELRNKANRFYKVLWQQELNDLKANYDWFDMNTVYNEVLRELKKLEWIHEWLKSFDDPSME